MRVTLLCWFLSLAAVVGGIAAQSSSPVVEARMILPTDAVHPNAEVKAAIVAQIAPGYHINDHHPSLDYLIPTELKFELSEQVSVEKIVYPKGKPQKLAFSDSALSVYENTVVIGALLKVPRTVRQGSYTIKGKFAYQACNDHACLPPASVPVALTLKVVARGTPVKRTHADIFDRINLE